MEARTAIKTILKRSPLYGLLRAARQRREIRVWEAGGRRGVPPPLFKRRILAEHADSKDLPTFVETGTYLGDTVQFVEAKFDRVVTIELNLDLYNRATRRFAGSSNVTVLHGDSGAVLPEVLATIDTPALFWLDGHYSEGITARGGSDTPILRELAAILAHPVTGHVVLIDDARCFDGRGDYPELAELEAFVKNRASAYTLSVRDDVIRLVLEARAGTS
jgi:hypothetical protein